MRSARSAITVSCHRPRGRAWSKRNASVNDVRLLCRPRVRRPNHETEPRGGKAWPELFVGRQSLPSRCGPIPRFPGALGRVRSYSTGALTSFNSAAAVDMDNMEVVVD